jgi:hypothetical protein
MDAVWSWATVWVIMMRMVREDREDLKGLTKAMETTCEAGKIETVRTESTSLSLP